MLRRSKTTNCILSILIKLTQIMRQIPNFNQNLSSSSLIFTKQNDSEMGNSKFFFSYQLPSLSVTHTQRLLNFVRVKTRKFITTHPMQLCHHHHLFHLSNLIRAIFFLQWDSTKEIKDAEQNKTIKFLQFMTVHKNYWNVNFNFV